MARTLTRTMCITKIVVHYKCLTCGAQWPGPDGAMCCPAGHAAPRAVGYVETHTPPETVEQYIARKLQAP